MQYTSLTDKNGKEIYEGDFLLPNQIKYPDEKNPFQVIFVDGCFRRKYAEWPEYLDYPVLNQYELDMLEYEIIGNIYENFEYDKL